MKKLLRIFLTSVLVLSLIGGAAAETVTAENLKVGFLFSTIGDEGYSFAHNLGRLALEATGVKTLYVEGVADNADCEKAARDLIDQGCNVIYGISFGYGEYMANVADEYPNVIFNHATGYITKDNMTTYMGRMYEAQYLAGIAAGMKTQSDKIGFVASFALPEVVRQINAFTLGVRSVNPDASVYIKWTYSWYDPTTEKAAAVELVNGGCDIMTAYVDTMNAQLAAADMGCYVIGCSSSGYDKCPDKYLTAPMFDWGAFYIASVQSILDGTWTNEGCWLGMAEGVVTLDALTNCAEGTEEAVAQAKQQIIDGTLFVFSGEIRDQSGAVRVAQGESMTDEQMMGFDWLVEGVVGSL